LPSSERVIAPTQRRRRPPVLTKGGQLSSDSDRVFAELAHERFCRPRPTAVLGPLDELRQAFIDMTLEVSLHAASKAAAGAAFARTTSDKPPG
jgi:hypothetical protein